jgi:Mn2+/Fe2+ NRAMP family transporter
MDLLDDLAQSRVRLRLQHALAVFGPGIVVMLADTDVGSIITAANSGVQFGYRMLGQQLLLVPILFVVQELTVRLGIFTGRGHGELIREKFGSFWAWVSACGLGVATAGALLTEFVVLTGSYRRVERAAIAVGLFEFVFFFVAWAAHPDVGLMVRQSVSVPWHNQQFWFLTAANVGAVIMPWMVFYQQSAVADKRLRPEHLSAARWDTALISATRSRPSWARPSAARCFRRGSWAPRWSPASWFPWPARGGSAKWLAIAAAWKSIRCGRRGSTAFMPRALCWARWW